tara:strand:+ start:144 stop:377 length:234 start_codon:yes stop_codon:yes gene_type:complete
VVYPKFLPSIHCLLKKRIPARGINIAQKEMYAAGKPSLNISPGKTKNIEPEKDAAVAVNINNTPDNFLLDIRRSKAD